jgi:hypothetical protein
MMKDAAKPRWQHCKVNWWQGLDGTVAEDIHRGSVGAGCWGRRDERECSKGSPGTISMDLVHASAKTPLAAQGQLLEKGWLARGPGLKVGKQCTSTSIGELDYAVRQPRQLGSQVVLTFLQVMKGATPPRRCQDGPCQRGWLACKRCSTRAHLAQSDPAHHPCNTARGTISSLHAPD